MMQKRVINYRNGEMTLLVGDPANSIKSERKKSITLLAALLLRVLIEGVSMHFITIK